jgi:hypothetical protein
MPAARRRRPAPAQVGRDQWAELNHPAPDRLAADLDAALGEQLLDVPDAEREPEVELHRISDHVRREPVALERDPLHQSPAPLRAQEPKAGDKLALDRQHRGAARDVSDMISILMRPN